MGINPKMHDALVKWLITSFTKEFFAHYFPNIQIGNYTFIDKEFISKYEALKESLKGDLFLIIEVEIEGLLQEIVIQIEHQSKKEDVSKRVYEYSCYCWLLKKKPVWSIVIYTDEANWEKTVSDRFWYGYSSSAQKQHYCFDIIKVKAEKSKDLIKKDSILCKLLALKADDMEFIETTISKHVYNQGLLSGIAEGEAKGIAKGEAKGTKGQLLLLESLYSQGILSKEQFNAMVKPIKDKLKELLS